MTPTTIGRGALAATLFAAALPAQYLETFSVRPTSTAGLFGEEVCIPGDLDGDGIDDLVVSQSLDNAVKVYSGASGAPMFEVSGPAGDLFGLALAAAGDVDADGVGDFVIGAPGSAGPDPSYAVVISGRTRGILHTLTAPAGEVLFGGSVDGAGDFNNDGFDDVVVSATEMTAKFGFSYVYSGRDGQQLSRRSFSRRLKSVAGLGDLDRDGFSEIGLGFFDGVDVEIYSGRTRGMLARLPAPSGAESFGSSLAAGDVDGDGALDVVVGAPSDGGSVFVFDNIANNQLLRLDGTGRDLLGAVVRTSDVDGDGRADVVIGAPSSPQSLSAGYVQVVRHDGTLDGDTIALLPGRFGGEVFGASVAVGDLNDDGRPDLLVGVPAASEVSPFGGRITTFQNVTAADPGKVTRFGAACDGSLARRMRLEVRERPILGETVTLRVRAAPFEAPGFVTLGVARSAIPLQSIGMPGCTDWVAELVTVAAPTDFTGSGRLGLAVPDDSGLVGLAVQAQWFVVDPAANRLGLVASGGLETRIGGG